MSLILLTCSYSAICIIELRCFMCLYRSHMWAFWKCKSVMYSAFGCYSFYSFAYIFWIMYFRAHILSKVIMELIWELSNNASLSIAPMDVTHFNFLLITSEICIIEPKCFTCLYRSHMRALWKCKSFVYSAYGCYRFESFAYKFWNMHYRD